jgi:hypothetical protein
VLRPAKSCLLWPAAAWVVMGHGRFKTLEGGQSCASGWVWQWTELWSPCVAAVSLLRSLHRMNFWHRAVGHLRPSMSAMRPSDAVVFQTCGTTDLVAPQRSMRVCSIVCSIQTLVIGRALSFHRRQMIPINSFRPLFGCSSTFSVDRSMGDRNGTVRSQVAWMGNCTAAS